MRDKTKTHRVNSPSTAEGKRFAQTILNSLSAHVAILDKNGRILETNLAWREFAQQNRIRMRPDTLNVNYLDICDNADGRTAGKSSSVAQGIREVIAGRSDEFSMEYPCHAPNEKRWFYMRVTRASGPGPIRIVVSHENITQLKAAEESVRTNEKALRREKRKLEEANTALKVLLRRREQDRRNMESDVLDNVRRLVAPVLNRLSHLSLPDQAKALTTSLETRLSELTQPFLRRLANIHSALTPQEIEVAMLVREGRTSKEIADQLCLSITTVNFHRRNLRRKLGLRNTRMTLRSFLMGLAK